MDRGALLDCFVYTLTTKLLANKKLEKRKTGKYGDCKRNNIKQVISISILQCFLTAKSSSKAAFCILAKPAFAQVLN